MIQKFKINPKDTNYILELELSKPEKTGIYVKEVTGLGYPSSSIPITDIALSDIDYYNHSTFDNRNVVFTLGFVSGINIELTRQSIISAFPVKHPIIVTIYTDITELYFTGYVETFETNIFSKEETIQISLICPNPYLIGSDPITNSYTGSPIIHVSNRQVNNGLRFFIENTTNGMDLIGLNYSKNFIAYGNADHFIDPFNLDDTSIKISSDKRLLFDTYAETFGTYITDSSNDVESDISGDVVLYGDYPFLNYGRTTFNIVSYIFKKTNEKYSRESRSVTHTGATKITKDKEPGWDSLEVHYTNLMQTSIIDDADFTSFVNTVPTIFVINFYDMEMPESDDKIESEHIIGNLIVKCNKFPKPSETKHSLERRINVLVSGQNIKVEVEDAAGNSLEDTEKVVVTSTPQITDFYPNPFYNQKNVVVENSNGFKDFLIKLVKKNKEITDKFGSTGIIRGIDYRQNEESNLVDLYWYESNDSEYRSTIMYDDYHSSL